MGTYGNQFAYSGYPSFYSGYPYGYYGYPYGYSGVAPVTAEVKTAAVATAAPVTTTAFAYSGFPYAYAPAVTANQYHSQDELGQASFGYSHPGQAAVNYRDAAGNQVGSWAYFSPEGKEVRVSYVADSNGFRVLSNALPEGPAAADLAMPEPVQDTAEVAAAKAAHMMALESAKAGVIMSPITSVDDLPKNVEDTPEVAAAKAAHFAALEAAKANDGALPEVVNPTNDLVAPMAVEDTPEVAAAKAGHAAAWEAALAAAQASGEESESRKKRSVFLNAFPWTPRQHPAFRLQHQHYAVPLHDLPVGHARECSCRCPPRPRGCPLQDCPQPRPCCFLPRRLSSTVSTTQLATDSLF